MASAPATTQPQPAGSQPAQPAVAQQYVNFAFYKADSAWRRLDDATRAEGRRQFAEVCKRYREQGVIQVYYSLVGIRGDCDLMIWRISEELPKFHAMTVELMQTGLGKYLTTPYSLLSMTKRSTYIDKVDPSHDESRTRVRPGKYKYIFVYPFEKKRDWYLLSKQTRQGIMDEHIEVGNKYRSVKLNTTYSFGLDDQEFVVAFETDFPNDFLDLVMELRETDGSRYTLRDTPIFTCMRMGLDEMLAAV
jgi:chlorite dismutase